MMVLWTPVLFGLTLMILLHALWEMAGYFSFRRSTYERMAGEPLAVFDVDPDLARAAESLGEHFEVRLRPGVIWVRRRHGVVKRLLAYGRVSVGDEGFLVHASVGPRSMLAIGAVVMPVFAVAPLVRGPAWMGCVVLLGAVAVFLGCRALLGHLARSFKQEVSVHL